VVARVVATCLILLVPTTLMGATLPLVSRFYITSVNRLGRGLGLLYAINTLGGVVGSGVVGYYTVLGGPDRSTGRTDAEFRR